MCGDGKKKRGRRGGKIPHCQSNAKLSLSGMSRADAAMRCQSGSPSSVPWVPINCSGARLSASSSPGRWCPGGSCVQSLSRSAPAVRRPPLAISSAPARSRAQPLLLRTRGAAGAGSARARLNCGGCKGGGERQGKGEASERKKREGGSKRQLQTESWCELAQSAKTEKSIAGCGGIKV